MNCKQVSEIIDLKRTPSSLWEKMHFYYHLMICFACRSYLKFGKSLQKTFKLMISPTDNITLENLNAQLLKKYSKAEQDPR